MAGQRNLDEHTITEAVIEQFAGTPDPRLKQILTSLVRQLHDSAYSPDLPGCVAADESPEEVEQLMREAIPLHIESLRAHGDPVPEPESSARYIAVG